MEIFKSHFKRSKFAVRFILAFLVSAPLNAADKQTVQSNAQSPLGLYQKLLGNWSIADYQLDQQGQWQSAGGADWNFYSILNGSAIQDDWIAPSLSQPEPAAGRQYGTNIRIFNAQLNQWQMAWMSNTGKKVETFYATEANGKIVMHGNYQGKPTRITFFNIENNHFSWSMEIASVESGKNDLNAIDEELWKVVYKIEGTRVKS